jgi:DNA repair exonuclease SbcCD ATPase subunit
LLLLLLAMCGLCGWQWRREHQLRLVATTQQEELDSVRKERSELESRVKAADAEVLRLTAAISELRQNSVSAQEHTDLIAELARLREAVAKQNETLQKQSDLLAQANASIVQANESIQRVAGERDAIATKLNEVTALYNELAAKRR